jgi:hypothetical protein
MISLDTVSGLFVFFSAVQNSQITLLILLARACLSGCFTILYLYMAMLYPATIRDYILLYSFPFYILSTFITHVFALESDLTIII